MNKNNTRSSELESLFTQRQIAKEEGWYDITKSYTNEIRRKLKKERLDETVQDLEEGLWYDTKTAKSNFIPSHTKLKSQDGTACASNERPDILADHFEYKQWGIDLERDKVTPTSKLLDTRNAYGRNTIDENITVETGAITTDEIKISIRKMKNNRSWGQTAYQWNSSNYWMTKA